MRILGKDGTELSIEFREDAPVALKSLKRSMRQLQSDMRQDYEPRTIVHNRARALPSGGSIAILGRIRELDFDSGSGHFQAAGVLPQLEMERAFVR